jgi:hypothetical protein
MKKTILVLLAFLVFASLSCQKENGVESAGNKEQSNSNTIKPSLDKANGNIHSVVSMKIYQDKDLYPTRRPILNVSFADDGIGYDQLGTFTTLSLPPGASYSKFDVECSYSWSDCLLYGPQSQTLYALYSISENVESGYWYFRHRIAKPQGSPMTGMDPNGSETTYYQDIYTVYPTIPPDIYRLQPNTTYKYLIGYGF